jgi:glutamine synthetase
MLASGLDGIKRNLPLRRLLNRNIYEMSGAERTSSEISSCRAALMEAH